MDTVEHSENQPSDDVSIEITQVQVCNSEPHESVVTTETTSVAIEVDPTNNSTEVGRLHLRKSLRPRKILMDYEQSPNNIASAEFDSSQTNVEKIDNDTGDSDKDFDRRKSLRPRRTELRSETYKDNTDIDILLKEESNMQAYGTGKTFDDTEYVKGRKKWNYVERILHSRSIKPENMTEAMLSAVSSLLPTQQSRVAQEYFVKLADLSYWHCTWMSGLELMAMQPSVVRLYWRQHQQGFSGDDNSAEQQTVKEDPSEERSLHQALQPDTGQEVQHQTSVPGETEAEQCTVMEDVTSRESNRAADGAAEIQPIEVEAGSDNASACEVVSVDQSTGENNANGDVSASQRESDHEASSESEQSGLDDGNTGGKDNVFTDVEDDPRQCVDAEGDWIEHPQYRVDISDWTSTKMKNIGSRRRELIDLGIESFALVPERVLAVSDTFEPRRFKITRPSGNKPCTIAYPRVIKTPPDHWPSVMFREVLVKWLHLPHTQATWETVEADLDSLACVASRLRKVFNRVQPLDSSERRLLPLLVRRYILHLTRAYFSRVANMLCDAYGRHKKVVKRPRTKAIPTWKHKWVGEQPDYLSPVHGAKLHPYQLEGVRWLWHAYHNKVNTILADEMGLGKTVQVIALLYSLWKETKDYGPFLIIAPLSTLINWEREFHSWAPDFNVLIYSGDKQIRSIIQRYELRIPNAGGLAAFHVLITSHEMACIERVCLQTFDWSVMVVDEAHRLKNKQSRLFREVSQYKVDFKILLTGTPIQNNLEELFHLLNFVDPVKFNDFKVLTEQWAEIPKEQRIAHLHDQLKHHLLRRLKVDVARDLPKKSEIIVMVDMTPLQRRLYKLVLTKNYKELRGGRPINSLIHLQKVCNHPYLHPTGNAVAPRLSVPVSGPRELPPYEPEALVQVSGKLVVLMQLLRGLADGGHRVLICSRMTSMLDILEEVLTSCTNYAYERIDGNIRGPMRQIIIDRFNNPDSDAFIFLLSTRAGGEGINLATADTVVLYDSDWNPQCDLQALSRAHRIGQWRPVIVYRFVTRNTMEERVQTVARRKLALTHVVVDQREQFRQLRDTDATGVNDNLAPTSSAADQEGGETRAAGPEGGDTGASDEEQPPAVDGEPADEEPRKTGKSDVVSAASGSEVSAARRRLTRAEMDELLRSGVENLFAINETYNEEDLFRAARTVDKSNCIVYNPDSIARLLDRSSLLQATDSSLPSSAAADEFLNSFRVAHFETVVATGDTSVSVPAADGADQQEQEPGGDGAASAPVEASGDAASPAESGRANEYVQEAANRGACSNSTDFWDSLLRERHETMISEELAASLTETQPRRRTRTAAICYQGKRVREGDTAAGSGKHPKTRRPTTGDGGSRRKRAGPASSRRRGGGQLPAARGAGQQATTLGNQTGETTGQSEREEVVPGYESLSEVEDGDGEEEEVAEASDEVSSSSSCEVSDNDPSYVPSSSDEVEGLEGVSGSVEARKSKDDRGSHLPDSSLMDTDDVLSTASSTSESSESKKAAHRKKASAKHKGRAATGKDGRITNFTYEEVIADEEDKSLLNSVAWHPADSVCKAWMDKVHSLEEEDKFLRVFVIDGHLFIYDFGSADREAFVNAVMRFGLPPPGIVPPQDWLPPLLLNKPKINVFAYTNLFMHHLYDDPNALDDDTATWFDGLPKENLCASAVLSRIAMMALIRAKVLQFEDTNGVHSNTFEAVSTRFRFTIHEGGLTLLRSTWSEEWQHINQMIEKVLGSSSNNSDSDSRQTTDTTHDDETAGGGDGGGAGSSNNGNATANKTANQRRDIAIHYLQRTWHSRHDYWLLSGVTVHGYQRWSELLSDTRFRMLSIGLEGIQATTNSTSAGPASTSTAAASGERAGTVSGQTSDEGGDSAGKPVSSWNMAEAHAFLLSRLRLLEHALLVEQALYEVALAALTEEPGSSRLPAGAGGEPAQSNGPRVYNLLVCLSNKLASAGPCKRISLPKEPTAREATRKAVTALQELLDDIYADLPGLPASLVCTELNSANCSADSIQPEVPLPIKTESSPDPVRKPPPTQPASSTDTPAESTTDAAAATAPQAEDDSSTPPAADPAAVVEDSSAAKDMSVIEISDEEMDKAVSTVTSVDEHEEKATD